MSPPPGAIKGSIGSPRLRLGVAVACHAIVDFFSFMVLPLLSVIEGRLELTPSQGATLVAVQPMIAGLAQPLTALVADRLDTRVPGVLGMVLAIACIGLIGQAQTYPQLLAIYAVGCFGIGAFHPVAVACVGELGSVRRGLAVSSFFVCGMAGGAAGSFVAPHYVGAWGLDALSWLIAPGLAAAMILGIAIRPVSHRTHDAHRMHASLTPAQRRARWVGVWILFAGAALRSAVHAAISVLVVRWSELVVRQREGAAALSEELRREASMISGPMIGALILGMAIGGFTVGSTIRPRHERRFLILFPVIGSAPILVFPRLGDWLGAGQTLHIVALSLAVLMGVAFAGLIPTGVSLCQRIMPHRTSLVSGLMLGGSWAAGAWGPDFAQMVTSARGLTPAFDAVAGLLALSGMLSIALSPGLVHGQRSSDVP